MAQIIFRTVDNSQADVAKNRLMYKTGDVVTVVDDSHLWGEGESKRVWIDNGKDPDLWPGGFFILMIPDMAVAEAMYLLDEAGDTEDVVVPGPDGDEVHTRFINNGNRKRRGNYVDFNELYNSLNKPTQRALDEFGDYTVTMGMVNNYLKVKV